MRRGHGKFWNCSWVHEEPQTVSDIPVLSRMSHPCGGHTEGPSSCPGSSTLSTRWQETAAAGQQPEAHGAPGHPRAGGTACHASRKRPPGNLTSRVNIHDPSQEEKPATVYLTPARPRTSFSLSGGPQTRKLCGVGKQSLLPHPQALRARAPRACDCTRSPVKSSIDAHREPRDRSPHQATSSTAPVMPTVS